MHEQSTDPPDPPPGYTIVREIGRGGFGTCWLALHRLTGCPVAIKAISGGPVAQRKALEREIGLWQSLEHPNIIHLYEVWSEGPTTCIIQEYAPGGDLFDLLDQQRSSAKQLPPSRGLAIFAQICRAVEYLHARGIAHRDLKLENILITTTLQNREVAKVGDFGFAISTAGSDLSQEWMGSIEYAAPEVLANEPYDPRRADCWSLGVVLFALLVGYLPFSKPEDDAPGLFDVEKKVRQRILAHDLRLPASIPDGSLSSLVKNLLHPNPAHRWSVTRALRALDQAMGRELPPEEPPPNLQRMLASIPLARLPGIQEWLEAGQGRRRLDAVNALCKIMQNHPGLFVPDAGPAPGRSPLLGFSSPSSASSSAGTTPRLRGRILLPSESPPAHRPDPVGIETNGGGWLGALWPRLKLSGTADQAQYQNVSNETTSSPELP